MQSLLRRNGAMLALALLSASALAGGSINEKDARKLADKWITPDNLRDYLTFIASDALLGRDTPSPGLDAAAQFLAFNLKKMGVKPAGDNGTYFQSIPLSKRIQEVDKTFVKLGTTTLAFDDIIARGWGSASGPAIYIGDALADGVDVKGKVVFVSSEFRRAGYEALRSKGAVAVVSPGIYDATEIKGQGAKIQLNQSARPPRSVEDQARADFPTVQFSKEAFSTAVGQAKPGDALSASAEIQIGGAIDTVMTQNVVGTLEGSDPKLKSEYVAIGAHYDHIGTNPKRTGDKIYNGADDDGSGTVSVLNIALAASSGPHPKRSLIFVWHAGEEKGLWGSDFFTSNPTVPRESIVTQLNIDMIGRTKKPDDTKKANKTLVLADSIYVIGTTMMSTRLGQLVHETNKNYMKLNYDSRYDAPNDPNQFFFRSDHFNYAKHGIPICFWFDGEHEDYHGVGDEVQKIDFVNMSKVARTVFVTAVNVANEPVRPPVDKPLEASRTSRGR